MPGEWAGGGDVGPDPVGLGPRRGAGRGGRSLPRETVTSQGLPQAAHAVCDICTWTGPQQAVPPTTLAPIRPPGATCWRGEVSGLAVAAPWGPGLPLGAADKSRWPAAAALGAGNTPSYHLMEEARSGGVESTRFIFLRKRPRKLLQSSGELAHFNAVRFSSLSCSVGTPQGRTRRACLVPGPSKAVQVPCEEGPSHGRCCEGVVVPPSAGQHAEPGSSGLRRVPRRDVEGLTPRMWLYLENGVFQWVIKVTWGPWVGSDPVSPGSLQEEDIRTQTCTEGRPHEDTGRGPPSTHKEGGLRRTPPCLLLHFDLRSPGPRGQGASAVGPCQGHVH